MNLENIKRIREEICGGCRTYEVGMKWSSPCRIPHKKNGHFCPCSQCLIKGLCENECDDLKRYKKFKTKRIKKVRKHKQYPGGSSLKHSYQLCWDKTNPNRIK